MAKRWAFFLLTTMAAWLVAHAVALFSHEFSHSFTAMALGWKSDPFALNWGDSSALNVLLQVGVDENVDYAPIFEHGHGVAAGLIALAGCGLGNLCLSLAMGVWLFGVARRRSSRVLGTFAYWLVVMSVGNLVSYVPLRVFVSHADMYTVQLGFRWSPWALLVYLGPVVIAAVAWFFARFQPRALAWLHALSGGQRYVTIVMTSLTLFGFFSLGGMTGYGDTAHRLSVAFLALVPLSICLSVLLDRRSAPERRVGAGIY